MRFQSHAPLHYRFVLTVIKILSVDSEKVFFAAESILTLYIQPSQTGLSRIYMILIFPFQVSLFDSDALIRKAFMKVGKELEQFHRGLTTEEFLDICSRVHPNDLGTMPWIGQKKYLTLLIMKNVFIKK